MSVIFQRLDSIATALDQLEHLHQPVKESVSCNGVWTTGCRECRSFWPCTTRKILDGIELT